MEKKSLLTANWLKAALLLMVMCFSGLYAQANTTNTVDLGEGNDGYIKPGQTYTIPANTIATGRYRASYDGTITFTSSVNANTNLVPFTDNTYTDIVESVRDEEARTKTFVIGRNKTFYFKSVVSTTPYEVKFDFVRPSNQEDYVESIVPEDGAVVKSLKDFTINFTSKIFGARNSAKLYKGETLVAEKALENKMNVNTYSFSFDEEITEPGDYTLVIPEESFVCSSSMIGSTEWKFVYTIEAGANLGALPISITPADGSTVEELKMIVFEFSAADYPGTMDYDGSKSPKLYNAAGEFVAEGQMGYADAITYMSLYVNFETPITEEGVYTLKVPEGAMVEYALGSDNPKVCPAFEVTYTIAGAAPQANMIISLVGGATAEEAVTLNNLNATATFENTTATITSEWTDFGIYGIVPGSTIETCYVHYSANKVSDTEYALIPNADQLATLDANTAYKFKLPEGYFTYADGSKSPAYETWIKYEAPSFEPVVITINPAGGTEDAPVGLAPEEVNFTLDIAGAESIAIGTAANNEETAISLQIWVDWMEDWSNVVVYKPELVEGTTYKLVPFDEYWAGALELLEAGKYRLHIPSGTFVYNGDLANVNKSFDTYYTVVLPDLTISPEPGSEIEVVENEGLMYVMLRFNNEKSVTPSNTVGGVLKKDGVVVEENVVGQKNWVQQSTVQYWFATNHIESGKYEFTVPADVITLGSGKAFEGVTVEYTVKGTEPTTPAIVVTPAGGTEEEPVAITEFEFIVKAENATRIDYAEGGGRMAINGWVVGRNGSEGYINSMWPTITRIDDTTLKLTLDNYSVEEILEGTTNGKYQLYIAAGDLWFNGDESQTCEEISLIYTYNSGVTVPEMVISPAVGSEVEVIDAETITVSFKNVDEVAINPLVLDYQNDVCILIDPAGNWISVYPEVVEGATNTFKFVTFDGQPQYPFTTAGTYGFYIPTGSFLVNGAEFEGVYYEEYITVAATSEAKMIVTPEDGATIESYKDIKISFEGVTTVEVNPSALNAEMGKVMLIPNEDWMNSAVAKPVAVEGETNVFTLEFIDGQLPESYKSLLFYMEEGTFFMDGADSPGIEYTYTVKSVGGEPAMIVTPEAGTTVKAITSDVVTISFENVSEVTINSGALNESSCKIMFMTPEGGYARVMPVAIDGETNKFKLVNFDGTDINLTAEGTYGLWIVGEFPQPAFYMDGTPCPSYYEANYLTVSSYSYTTEPAEGYVTSLKDVAITFNPGAQGMMKDAAGDVVLYKDGEEVEKVSVDNLSLLGWDPVLGMSLVVSFSKEYTENGEYKIVVPANVVELSGGIANKEITLNYTIGGVVSDWTAVADPAPGVVSELTTIYVTFEGATQIAVSPEAGPNDFPYYGTIAEDGTVTKVPYSIFSFAEGLNVVSLTIQNEESKLSEPGKYAIIIPATYCLVDGIAMTEDIRFDYTIEGAQPEYTIILNPADGATVNGEQLYEITVTFDGAKAIELNGDQATTLYQLDENGKPIANIYQNMSVEGNVAKFTVMELHKPYLDAAGTFQFTIPVGMVTITDNNDVVGKNKENIVATYYSNGVGVDTIGVDAKDLNIYTINGMLIKRNGTYEDVKALEPGIYIINGKKFYVK